LLTGWAQDQWAGAEEIDNDEKIKPAQKQAWGDLYYIENWVLAVLI